MAFKMRLLFSIVLILNFISSGYSQTTFRLTGKVIDFDSHQPVKNVSIVIQRTRIGTITNDSGYFDLGVRIADFSIAISCIGYATTFREIHLALDNRPLTIELKKKANDTMEEVVVNANKVNAKVSSVDMNVVKINTELIKRSPLLLGEADIIKALILQPGITNAGEGAGGFNVRGGNADQNLVLVDGAPLFNTSHLLGFFSSVSPDAIQDLTLYKGGMPAEYGGRISSLLSMKIKNGNNNRVQYTGGIGPVSARLFANGPLIKDKLTFTSGFRMAYPDLVLNQLKDKFGGSRAFFYDGIAKAELSINSKNKISLTGYRSFDNFRFDTLTAYSWESNLVAMNFVSEISSKWTFKLNANYSKFISTIKNLEPYYEYKVISSITQKQLKPVLIYKASEKQTFQLGVDYILTEISPGTRTPGNDSSNINSLGIPREQGREMAVFISDEINLTERISLQAGIRYAGYDYLGPKTIYSYLQGVPLSKETITDSTIIGKNKSIKTYAGLEPRIALKIGLDDETSIKLSFNRGQQFLHLISNTTAISPVDFWKLSDQYINRQIGDQYAFGFFKSYTENRYDVAVELYYKKTKNMVQYKDGALLLLNPYIESALLNQRGRSYGIELSFSKNIGKHTGQVNYTYSRSMVQVLNEYPSDIVNGGNYYPADVDRPHNLAIIYKIKLAHGWSFSTNFIFTSGRPATFPDGNYTLNGTLVTNYSKRNMDRLPAYHRLDAGFTYISKRYPEQRKFSVWNFSFYNLYMHKNVYSIYFKREDNKLKAYQLSVVGGLIPSITWNFNF